MLRLRQYKSEDSVKIAEWLSDKRSYNTWGGTKIGEYPLTAELINDKYMNENGFCEEPDNFYPWIAFDENGPVGHFIMRYLHGDNKCLRFGWVVVDSKLRGKGYGKEMLRLGLKYAFEILGVDSVNLGVYDINPDAYHCYKAVGFTEVDMDNPISYDVDGEKWTIIEMEITKEAYNE